MKGGARTTTLRTHYFSFIQGIAGMSVSPHALIHTPKASMFCFLAPVAGTGRLGRPPTSDGQEAPIGEGACCSCWNGPALQCLWQSNSGMYVTQAQEYLYEVHPCGHSY